MGKHEDETDQQYLNRTYNGWEGCGNKASAYATWRICLELFDDPEAIREAFPRYMPSEGELADHLKQTAEEYICCSVDDEGAERLATQYALAFADNVDWYEIAEHLLRDWPEEEDEGEEGDEEEEAL